MFSYFDGVFLLDGKEVPKSSVLAAIFACLLANGYNAANIFVSTSQTAQLAAISLVFPAVNHVSLFVVEKSVNSVLYMFGKMCDRSVIYRDNSMVVTMSYDIAYLLDDD